MSGPRGEQTTVAVLLLVGLVVGVVAIGVVAATAADGDSIYTDDFDSFNENVWNTSALASHDTDAEKAVLIDSNSDSAEVGEWEYTSGVGDTNWYTRYTYSANESAGGAYFTRLWFGAEYTAPGTEPTTEDGYRVEFNMRDDAVSVYERAGGSWSLVDSTDFDLEYDETVAARYNATRDELELFVVRDGVHASILTVDGVDVASKPGDNFYVQGKKDSGQSGYMTMDDFVLKHGTAVPGRLLGATYSDDFAKFNDSIWATSELARYDADGEQAVLVEDDSDTAAKGAWDLKPGIDDNSWYTRYRYSADDSRGDAYFTRLWFAADYSSPTSYGTTPTSENGYRVEFNIRDDAVSVYERDGGSWSLVGSGGFDLQYDETVAARYNATSDELELFVVRDGDHQEILSVAGVDMASKSGDHFYVQGKKDDGQSGLMTMDDFVLKRGPDIPWEFSADEKTPPDVEGSSYTDEFTTLSGNIWDLSDLSSHDATGERAILMKAETDDAAKGAWEFKPGTGEELWYTRFTYSADSTQGGAYFTRLWFAADYNNPTAYGTTPTSDNGYRVEFNMRDDAISVYDRSGGSWSLLGSTTFDLQFDETVAARYNATVGTLNLYVVRDGAHQQVLSVDGVDVASKPGDHFYIQGKKDVDQSGFMAMDDFVFKRSGTAQVSISDLRGPSAVLLRDNLTVTATVNNEKLRSVNETMAYRIKPAETEAPESVELTKTLPLAPGESRTVHFDVPLEELESGAYTHGIYTSDVNETAQVRLVEQSETTLGFDSAAPRIQPGESLTVPVTYAGLSNGLSGADLTATTEYPSVLKIADANVAATYEINDTILDGRDARVRALDTSHAVEPGASNGAIGTITVRGDEPGFSTLEVSQVTRIEDDYGFPIATSTETSTVTVVQPINVDVKPGDDEVAPINPRSQGVVPVAIETTEAFDAASVNVSSLRFGTESVVDAGEGATPAHDGHLEDIDGDGDQDLVVHFEGDGGFEVEDDEAVVEGATTEGIVLVGNDSIRVVGPG